MKIFINGRFLSQRITGVQRMAREFTRALDRLLADGELPGIDVTMLVQSDARFGDLALEAITVRTIRGARSHVWEQLLLPFHTRGGTLLNLGNTVPIASLTGRRKAAVVLHDISYRVFPTAYRLRYRMAHRVLNLALAARADPIVTVAESERAMIRHFHPGASDRVIVAQNGGWPDDMLEPLPEPEKGERYGLYVGSLSLRKNLQGVLATALVLARERGLRFKIVGATSPILSEIVLDIPTELRASIDFCGQIDDPVALKALYRGAAFLLFPSFYEASALPPMEAMAQCCPVIVSDIPSLVERCGDAALYCDPTDLDSMVAATKRVLDDPALASTLVTRGGERSRRFTWRAQAEAIIGAIRD